MTDPSLGAACVCVLESHNIFNNKTAELQFRENLLEYLYNVARGDFELLPLVLKKKGGKLSNSLIGFYTSLRGEMQVCSLPSYEAWCVL